MNTKKVQKSVESFFLRPAYATPLAALRIGLAFVLLLQAFMLRHALFDLFSQDGLVQGDLANLLGGSDSPKIAWIVQFLSYFHFQESSALYFTGGVYILGLIMLLVGYQTRVFAFSSWLLHWMFVGTSATMAYGVDLYAHVFLFYLIFVPAGNALSLDVYLGRKKNIPTPYARLGLRLMQLQLCISYLVSAKEKAVGIQWWNGEVIWRSLTGPFFQSMDLTWVSHWPVALMIAGWMSLLLEGAYCVFIWPQRTRNLWILGIISLHSGIAVFIGLQLFGLIMCMLTPALFYFSPDKEPAPSFA